MVDTTSMAMSRLGATQPMPKNLGSLDMKVINHEIARERIPSWQRRKGIVPKVVAPLRGGRA
jgi:hypothetical protein